MEMGQFRRVISLMGPQGSYNKTQFQKDRKKGQILRIKRKIDKVYILIFGIWIAGEGGSSVYKTHRDHTIRHSLKKTERKFRFQELKERKIGVE